MSPAASPSGIRTKKKIFNTGIMFGRKGEVACHYHKQFLATHDQNWFAFGERGCPVVETDLGRIGLLICFDGRIPEIFRAMAMQGAEVIVDMANFFAMDQADMWGPARAYENGVWLVAATKAGYERSIYYPGGSMIVDPKGRVVSKVPYDTHGMAVATIDLDAGADKSIYAANDKIADRRPETYGIMALPYEKTPVFGIAEKPLIPARSVTKVAAIQMHVTGDCRFSRRPRHDRSHRQARREGAGAAGIRLLPRRPSPMRAEAAALADQTAALLAKVCGIAAKYQCLIAVPGVERAAEGLYVTTFLIGPDGKEIGQIPQNPPHRRRAVMGQGRRRLSGFRNAVRPDRRDVRI